METLKKLLCLRCKKTWWPKSTKKPKTCPRCRSPYWDKPRKSEVLNGKQADSKSQGFSIGKIH